MRSVALLLAGTLIVLAGAGCAREARRPPAEPAPKVASTPPPANSPLAAVHEGMRPEDVQRLLGVPTAVKPYITGKAFIPFYYGPDRTRTAYYYKGQGRVVFSGDAGLGTNSRVVQVDYDPSDPGYPR